MHGPAMFERGHRLRFGRGYDAWLILQRFAYLVRSRFRKQIRYSRCGVPFHHLQKDLTYSSKSSEKTRRRRILELPWFTIAKFPDASARHEPDRQ